MNRPTEKQFLAAVAKIDRLIPAPRTLGRALRLLRDPDSGLQEIAQLISSDSALAADVLRCANSAYYGRESDIGDVSEAVQVVGFRETTKLVNLVAVHQTTNRNLRSYGIAAEDFWAESLFSGLFLEKLGEGIEGLDSGEAYTTGLLRFVGRLAIDQALIDLGGAVSWDGTTPLTEWERVNVGLTQADVGARLLKTWNFPTAIIEAVQSQDAVTSDEAGTGPLAQALHFVAQILPAGSDVVFIESLTAEGITIPEDNAFAQRNALTNEAAAELIREAQVAFTSIRETLYH